VPTDAAVAAAIAVAEGRLAAERAVDDMSVVARLLGYLGNGHRLLGHHDEAAVHLEEACGLARAGGNRRGELVYHLRLADTLRCRGDLALAETMLRDAVERSRAPGMVVASRARGTAGLA